MRTLIRHLLGALCASLVLWFDFRIWGWWMEQMRQHDALLALLQILFTIAAVVVCVVLVPIAYFIGYCIGRLICESFEDPPDHLCL